MLLQTIDKLQIQVLVDNVTDSLSSVPDNVTHEMAYLKKMACKNSLENVFVAVRTDFLCWR